MIRLEIQKSNSLIDRTEIEKLISDYHPVVQKSILRYGNLEGLNKSFKSKQLLLDLISKEGFEPSKLDFFQNEYGKLDVDANIQFSNAHSKNHIISAISNRSIIGVDIEEFRSVREGIAKRYFLKKEHEFIQDSSDVEKAFYYIWTRKEAIVKAIGMGIQYGLQKFSVLDDVVETNDSVFQLHTQMEEEYCWSVGYEGELEKSIVLKTKFS